MNSVHFGKFFENFALFGGLELVKKTGKNDKITSSQAPQKSLNQYFWSKIMLLPCTCYWPSIMGSFALFALLELKL